VPLWIALIDRFGFPIAANVVGSSMIAVVTALAVRFLRHGPSDLGLNPDGAVAVAAPNKVAPTVSRFALLLDRRFLTLSSAFAIGLFAQIGLFAHLIVRLSPAMGIGAAGAAVSVATVCAVIGRSIVASWLGDAARRGAGGPEFSTHSAGGC